MKANFVRQHILYIALAVLQYKKMYVLTNGQMFQKESDAEKTARTLNQIIEDPMLHVGIKVITEDMVSEADLRMYGKFPEKFNELFNDAIIPLARGTRDYEGRKYEAPVEQDEDEKARLAALLGDDSMEPTKEPKQVAEQEPKQVAEQEPKQVAEQEAEQEAEKAVKDVEAEKAAAEKAAAEKALAAASKFAPKKK